MDKETIFSEMKTRLGKTQLSDRTLNAYLEANLPAEGAEPDDAYYDAHLKMLKTIEGQVNNEVAAVLRGRKPKEEPKTEDKPDPTSVAMAELQRQMEELKSNYERQAKEAHVAAMRSELVNKAGEIKVANAALWKDVVDGMAVADDATADSLLTAAKTAYESKLKAYMGEGATPYGGTGNPGGEDLKKSLGAFADALRASGKIPAKKD